jgi:hypothetical protein
LPLAATSIVHARSPFPYRRSASSLDGAPAHAKPVTPSTSLQATRFTPPYWKASSRFGRPPDDRDRIECLEKSPVAGCRWHGERGRAAGARGAPLAILGATNIAAVSLRRARQRRPDRRHDRRGRPSADHRFAHGGGSLQHQSCRGG